MITGIRRCGKSFLLSTIFKRYLLENDVDTDHIIEIALDGIENEELRDPSDTSYNIKVEKHISAINRFLAQNLVSDIFDQTIFKRSIITKEKKFNRESLNILQKYKNKLGIKMLPSKYREKLKKQLFN